MGAGQCKHNKLQGLSVIWLPFHRKSVSTLTRKYRFPSRLDRRSMSKGIRLAFAPWRACQPRREASGSRVRMVTTMVDDDEHSDVNIVM